VELLVLLRSVRASRIYKKKLKKKKNPQPPDPNFAAENHSTHPLRQPDPQGESAQT
jgi:hypothetical protein